MVERQHSIFDQSPTHAVERETIHLYSLFVTDVGLPSILHLRHDPIRKIQDGGHTVDVLKTLVQLSIVRRNGTEGTDGGRPLSDQPADVVNVMDRHVQENST